MIRLGSILIFIVCVGISISIPTAHGQEAELMGSSATIRGEVIEATPELKPIPGVTVTIVNSSTGETYTVTTDKDGVYEKTGLPAGRYTIAVNKKGYGERVGKSKVVAPGGEIYDRIKMIKKDNIIIRFLGEMLSWQLVVGFLLGYAVALILNPRRSGA